MRELHRLKIEICDYLVRRMKHRHGCGLEEIGHLEIMTVIEEIDTKNPLLILRHDGHYERYCNVKVGNREGVNSGYLRPGTTFIDNYLDSLIEGTTVSLPGGSYKLLFPEPVKLVIDFAGDNYDAYFEKRKGVYQIVERQIQHPSNKTLRKLDSSPAS